jgi:hypothetical protein
MAQEDKVLLLAECVPMVVGNEEERQACRDMISIIPPTIAAVKGKCPGISKGEAQLVGEWSDRCCLQMIDV